MGSILNTVASLSSEVQNVLQPIPKRLFCLSRLEDRISALLIAYKGVLKETKIRCLFHTYSSI